MSQLLKGLLDERNGVWEQAKTVLEKAETEKRSLTPEEDVEYKRMSDKMDDLQARMEQVTERLAREEQADEARAQMERFVRPDEELQRSGAVDTIDSKALEFFRSGQRGAFEVPVSGISVVRSNDGGYEVRDLLTTSAATGGATVPVTFRRDLFSYLIENSGIRQTRAQIISTASGEPMIFPKVISHTGLGTIVAEGAVINEDDPVFGQGTLNAYKYAKLVQVSNEMLTDTGIDLLGYLAQTFGQQLANGSGADMIVGNGTNKPQGVIAGAGTIRQVTGGTGVSGAPTADNLIDLFYTVTEPYANQGEWLMRRATVGAIRKLKDSTGQYLWQPSLQVGQPETILGHPVRTDPNVPAAATGATSVAFGDFSKYLIRDVGSVRFERSDEFAFDRDMATFRVILRTDGDLTDLTGAIGTFKGGAT
jgi:HK97 family phage major capsid protein